MEVIKQIIQSYLNTFKQQKLLGKIILGGGPFLLLCCVCSLPGALSDRDPTATPIARVAAVNLEPAQLTPTAPPPTSLPTDTPTTQPTDTPTTQPTDTSTPQPTDTPTPLPTSTEPPPPTNTVPAGPVIIITRLNKSEEYVDIQNIGSQAQDLSGWNLVSIKGNQQCPLAGVIGPGETLRIWAKTTDANQGGFNCGHNDNIWNNSEEDPAILYNAAGEAIAASE